MTSSKTISNNDYYDAVLVGAGIMSSTLLLLLSEVLPDIKIDFNDNFKNWESYFKNFNVNKSVSELPESNSEKEKYYIVGRGIQSAYYKVRSLEERLNNFL